MAKLQEKEREVEEKVKKLGELLAEREELEDKLAKIESGRELAQIRMEEVESNFEAKIALLEIQLKEAEADTPSFPDSSKRGRVSDEEDESGAAKSFHLDEDHFMKEEEVSGVVRRSEYPPGYL